MNLPSTPRKTSPFTTLLMVDKRVANRKTLISQHGSHARIVTVDPEEDPITAIEAALTGHPAVKAISIVAYAESDHSMLGNGVLDITAISARAEQISAWQPQLARKAHLSLQTQHTGTDGVGFIALMATLLNCTLVPLSTVLDSGGRFAL